MFTGAAGEKLRQALEQGNFLVMQQALQENETLNRQREQLIINLNNKINTERAKDLDKQNQALLAQ